MESGWRKVKRALAAKLCGYVLREADGGADNGRGASRSAAASGSRMTSGVSVAAAGSGASSNISVPKPTTPTTTSGELRLAKSGTRSSEKTCAICLEAIKTRHGQALFTAECSHTFHYHCIASNVKYGNHVCPVCRAKWKEIPFQGSVSSEYPLGRARINPVPQDYDHPIDIHRLHHSDSSNRLRHQFTPHFHTSEPGTFNDDDPLDLLSETANVSQQRYSRTVDIITYPEFLAIPQSASLQNFNVLIHLKARKASVNQNPCQNVNASSAVPHNSRAPVDLVAVLDVSGSMAGSKIALLKRAMGFVIQNLGPSDRLSIVAFSSTACRLCPLLRMSNLGRQQAQRAVSSLSASGGTNIARALRKGAKVIEECRMHNPVCSIILLSDGHDTYTLPSSGNQNSQRDYSLLVPSSILGTMTHQIPVHAFGFGSDHDSAALHSISEISGGTFSFIESQTVIQDALAQCIGGLLSVVVQEMQVFVECVHHGVKIAPIKSGSYANHVAGNARTGLIKVGALYADEERDFLISVNVPRASTDILLLKVGCSYKDPVSKESIHLEIREVMIQRPASVTAQNPSVEVDRERNRILAAEAMSRAKAAADRGALSEAVSILEEQRRVLSASLTGHSADRLCLSLDAEMKEMQERMANRERYEESGRAYLLSGLSSHSWQRATARGDSTESTTLVYAYQTPSMVDMIQRSHTHILSPRGVTPPT